MSRRKLSHVPVGRVLISATAVATTMGPYMFDYNETHIFNEQWPPHAKFHNAQTMCSGVLLSLAALYHLWRPRSPGAVLDRAVLDRAVLDRAVLDRAVLDRAALDSAAISASVYWVSQLSARLYPGTASVDPPGEDTWPQLKFALPILGSIGSGYLLERLRLRRDAAARGGAR